MEDVYSAISVDVRKTIIVVPAAVWKTTSATSTGVGKGKEEWEEEERDCWSGHPAVTGYCVAIVQTRGFSQNNCLLNKLVFTFPGSVRVT
jgi:hypothetical protein